MSAGIRHDDLRKRNRAMVLSAVRRAAQPSRTEIAVATGLSHSTISAISSDLIGEGILIEVKGSEPALAKRGRPQVALTLNPSAAMIVAVTLSLNFLSAAAIDYAGRTIHEEHLKLQTQKSDGEQLVAEAVGIVRRVAYGLGPTRAKIVRIVLAIQGITDSDERRMLWSPITPHTDIPFADALEQSFGVPVTVENDCNMMAVALRWRRPERYRDDFLTILLSHGIGMGLVLKGELFTGTRSSGGEFGHMVHRPGGALCRCGRRGCIEAYAGNYAIWRSASGHAESEEPAADISDADIRLLAERARAADGPEREAFRKAGEALGYGLGNLFALIDAAPVAFVGVGASAFDLIEPHMRAAIAMTAGGQHSSAIVFDTEPNEIPLIREGCVVRALSIVDQELFAQGSQIELPGKEVA